MEPIQCLSAAKLSCHPLTPVLENGGFGSGPYAARRAKIDLCADTVSGKPADRENCCATEAEPHGSGRYIQKSIKP